MLRTEAELMISETSREAVPTVRGILRAHERIHEFVKPSPLYRSSALSSALSADVWLKIETTSEIACFKLRGALNSLLCARERGGQLLGAVTSSTGNHGQGVAYAAALLRLSADIFVPEDVQAVKAAMIRLFGAKLHVGGHDIDDAKDRARAHALAHGTAFIDDGDDVAVIEGAGTIGLEVANALEGVDLVLVPMGGGSLAAGTAVSVKSVQPSARVVAVQSSGSPAMVESFKARRPLSRPVQTIADCLVTRIPAKLALDTLINNLDDAWLVSDLDLLAATHTLLMWGHTLVEPGASAGLAGLWARRSAFKGKRIVIVLTGANVGAALFARVLTAEPFFNEEVLKPRAFLAS